MTEFHPGNGLIRVYQRICALFQDSTCSLNNLHWPLLLFAGVIRPFLVRDDFAPFFPSKDQADQAFAYFDKDNDAQLSIKEMKDSVTAIFKVTEGHKQRL